MHMNTRLKYGVAALALFFIELYIALYVHDSFIRPFFGDVLVVILLYCIIRIAIPNKVKLLPLYIFLFAACVEALQYFKTVELIGLGDNRFFRVLMGTSFDFRDILCYAAGCVFTVLLQCEKAQKYEIVLDIALPPELEEKLLKVNLREKDTLIGSLRCPEQLTECLNKKYYYVPAIQLDYHQTPIRYVAMYESKLGIRYYGKVIKSYRIQRRKIPFYMSKNNPDEMYYAFFIDKWIERKPIRYREISVYKARFTNLFLLENSDLTYELFSVYSSEQYRLLYKMKRIYNEAPSEHNTVKRFRLDDKYTVHDHDGKFELVNENGKTVFDYFQKDFEQKPGTVFKRIVGILGL